MENKGTVEIKSKRLIFRRFTIEDAEQVYNNWASDDEVTFYLTWPTHKSVEDTKQLINKWLKEYESDYYHWGIEYNGELIGSIAARPLLFSHDIGYCFSKKYWGNGFATEALTRVIRFLLGECGYHKVMATHSAINKASGRVMQKSGMIKEAKLKKQYKAKTGEYVDMYVYGLLKDEWINKLAGL